MIISVGCGRGRIPHGMHVILVVYHMLGHYVISLDYVVLMVMVGKPWGSLFGPDGGRSFGCGLGCIPHVIHVCCYVVCSRVVAYAC